jgi:hypothetical protein
MLNTRIKPFLFFFIENHHGHHEYHGHHVSISKNNKLL